MDRMGHEQRVALLVWCLVSCGIYVPFGTRYLDDPINMSLKQVVKLNIDKQYQKNYTIMTTILIISLMFGDL